MPIEAVSVLAGVGRSAGLILLLAPVAMLAARWAGGESRDRAVGLIAGIAAAAGTFVLTGLVLSVWAGVGRTGWLVALGLIDLLIVGTALGRGARPGRLAAAVRSVRWRAPPLLALALSAAAVALAAVAVAGSVSSARRDEKRTRFTQLWLLPAADGRPVARLGVANLEHRNTSYRVVLTTPGRELLSTRLQLSPGRSWTREVVLPRPVPRALVTARLYLADDLSPYRTVNVWTPAP